MKTKTTLPIDQRSKILYLCTSLHNRINLKGNEGLGLKILLWQHPDILKNRLLNL